MCVGGKRSTCGGFTPDALEVLRVYPVWTHLHLNYVMHVLLCVAGKTMKRMFLFLSPRVKRHKVGKEGKLKAGFLGAGIG